MNVKVVVSKYLLPKAELATAKLKILSLKMQLNDTSIHLLLVIYRSEDNVPSVFISAFYFPFYGKRSFSSFEPDVVCSMSVIPLQHISCALCMSFVRLGHHNG